MAAPRSFNDYLHPDMQSHILITQGVPTKSLLSFRCISRDCYSLISSSSFISEHFKFNLSKSLSDNNDNNNNGYLLCNSIERGLCTVLCNTDHTLTEISSFEIPIDYDRVVGFCNSILCFVRERHEAPSDSPPDKRIFPWTSNIYLCNPSIREFMELPHAHVTDRFEGVACGLGYNSQNNDFDFKVLRFGRFFGNDLPDVDGLDFQVYSLRENSWERLGSFIASRGPTTEIDQSSGLFFNSALHFIAKSHDHKFILSFDLCTLNFREIALPQKYDGLRFERLAELNGSLTWISFGEVDVHTQDLIEVCHICEMKVYGAAESWTERTLQLEDVENFFGCTGRGELVIKKSSIPNQLFLFHPVTQVENNIDIGDLAPVIYTPKLIESLILLKS